MRARLTPPAPGLSNAPVDPRTVSPLPNLIIIGAMKAGTTSLHHYIGLHPEIQMSEPKELRFFVNNWERGQDWYASHFDSSATIRGEATPAYSKHPFFPGVPERMHSVVPAAKLIYLVRDPIERAVSQYIHNFALGRERRPIDDALSDVESSRYVQCSRYHMQLSRYLEYYSPAQILVLSSEELRAERLPTVKRVFDFLEVDSSFADPAFEQVRHASAVKREKSRLGLLLTESRAAKAIAPRAPRSLVRAVQAYNSRTAQRIDRPVPSEETRELLAEYFADDVERLRNHTGLAFESWAVRR